MVGMDTLWSGLALQVALVIALAFSILGLQRHVRKINARLPAAGALTLSGGPPVGTQIGPIDFDTLGGGMVTFGGAYGTRNNTLIFFFSPTCPISKAMLPVVQSFHRECRLWFATDGDNTALDAFFAALPLPKERVIVSEELGRVFGIGRVPQAVLLSPEGKIAARGLVNTREHLESLFNAASSGTATLQEHIAQQS
ncbi:MAG: thiol-disulfide isomerase [Pseudomonadota bacterium]